MAEHQKYRISERIDAGGMAEVFRGVAESLQGFKKNVAIKRILPHLCKNKKFIQMFLDEAKLSLHLQHANIVGVFDIGVSPAGPESGGGAYFIVMEYVDGSHLKGVVESLRRQGRSLTVAQVLYIVMQVCNGLAYAHDVTDGETGRPLGIVHRDISPPNILISKNGEVKLVDFGLAKATSQLESTDPGVVKGKFSYLSPEAAHGKDVDRRADIFAVGILMYELLTGKRLFYGENDYQTVELVRQARVPSIRQQNADVDEELEAIVRRALARDVNARYQTAGELQEAVAQHLFSRGQKVTSRDIAQIVQGCLAERARSQPTPVQQKSLIDTLILEELNKFTSLEAVNQPSGHGVGARPLSPEELGVGRSPPGGAPMISAGEELIDTSNWSAELTGEGPAIRKSAARGGAAPSRNGQSPAGRSGDAPAPGTRRVTPPVTPAVARRSATPYGAANSAQAQSLAEVVTGEPAERPRRAEPPTLRVQQLREREPELPAASDTERGGNAAAVLVAVLMLLLVVGGGAVLLLVRGYGH